MSKRVIVKTQLDIIFRQWEFMDVEKYGIAPEDVINVIEYNGAAYLIYWRLLDESTTENIKGE